MKSYTNHLLAAVAMNPFYASMFKIKEHKEKIIDLEKQSKAIEKRERRALKQIKLNLKEK